MAEGWDDIGEQHIRISEDFYAKLCSGDMRCFDLVDPEIEFNTFFGDVRGPEGMVAYFQGVSRSYDDHCPHPDEFIPAGDRLLVVGLWKGTVRASGERIEARTAHVKRFRDGLIRVFDVYIDSAKVLAPLEGAGDGPSKG